MERGASTTDTNTNTNNHNTYNYNTKGSLMTQLIYTTDAYVKQFSAHITDLDHEGHRVQLNRTAFYPTGGGQPHDTGFLSGSAVKEVVKDGDTVWHTIDPKCALPQVDDEVFGVLDWKRRHALMQTHTAVHVLCGVVWRQWGVPVTGGNMEPHTARVDFEFGPLPAGFNGMVEQMVNEECRAGRRVEVSFIQRDQALGETDLIRTKVSLVPPSVKELRIVDIVGLDRQADGGTHVANTADIGSVRLRKTESKGKGHKRVRLEIIPPPSETPGVPPYDLFLGVIPHWTAGSDRKWWW